MTERTYNRPVETSPRDQTTYREGLARAMLSESGIEFDHLPEDASQPKLAKAGAFGLTQDVALGFAEVGIAYLISRGAIESGALDRMKKEAKAASEMGGENGGKAVESSPLKTRL